MFQTTNQYGAPHVWFRSQASALRCLLRGVGDRRGRRGAEELLRFRRGGDLRRCAKGASGRPEETDQNRAENVVKNVETHWENVEKIIEHFGKIRKTVENVEKVWENGGRLWENREKRWENDGQLWEDGETWEKTAWKWKQKLFPIPKKDQENSWENGEKTFKQNKHT